MTENKRFTVIRKKNPVSKEIGNYVQDMGTTILKLGFLEDCKDVCDILNELNNQADAVRTELQLCEEENNELQTRNNRQAETIRKLYTLIGNKDWKALTTYMEALDSCEEQLRKE